jgi:hypothetical protein
MHAYGPLWETETVRCTVEERVRLERVRALLGWVVIEWHLEEDAITGAPGYMLSFRRASPGWLLQARSDETAGKHREPTSRA